MGNFNPKQSEEIKNSPQKNTIPPFPIDGFPIYLQNLIKECSDTFGTPVDFWAAGILAGTGLAIGNAFHVNSGKFLNSAALWYAIISPTGSGKTEPIDFAFKPFSKLDYENFELWKIEAEKSKNSIEQQPKDEIFTSKKTALPEQFILNDFTPESLSQVHHNNPRGIAVVRDELGGWWRDFNRYNKSGEVQNWLSIYMGKSVVYNRKDQAPIRIDKPCVTIAGGFVPSDLQEMAKGNNDQNGLMQRFCFIFPDQCDRPLYSDRKLLPDIQKNYEEYILKILAVPMPVHEIPLSVKAVLAYSRYYNTNVQKINGMKSDYVRGVYAKLDIIVLRIALLLHVSNMVFEKLGYAISESSMSEAIKICEYFEKTALKVHSHLSKQQEETISKGQVARFLNEMGDQKSQSEIARILNVSQPYINKILS